MVTATCDASTALGPAEVRDIGLRWTGDTALVAGAMLQPVVTVTIDGETYARARLRFSSGDPAVVRVGPDGRSLHAVAVGTALVTVQLLDAALPSPLPSISQAVVVSPFGLTIATVPDTLRSLGDTVRLDAKATDATGAPLSGIAVAWSTSDTSVATIDATGLLTARRNGAVQIAATVGAARVEAPVIVQQRPAAIVPSARTLLLDALGADSLLSADVVDARGVALGASSPAIAWTSASPGTATVGGGRITAVGAGRTWIHLTAGSVRDSIDVDVTQRATRVVIETPLPLLMRSVGETAVLRARAYDRRDNEVTIATPSWRSLHPFVAHVESRTGIVTGLAAGSATLVAELDGASATAPIEVADVPARLVLEPEAATLTSVGDTLPLATSVRNARGVEIPGVTVTFGSTDTAIVRSLASGHAVAVGTGTARVIARTDGGVADTALVTVVNAVAHVEIGMDVATLASVGDTLAPPATIRNARSAELPRSAAAWSSGDAGVARVSAAGIVVATGDGETVIRAVSPHFPDRRDSLTVIVTNAPASVVIERDSDVLTAVGASRTYAAEVRNARNALLTVAPAWRSADAGVARASTTGLVTAVAPGTARIIAEAGAAADTLLLTVRDDVASLEVSPATASLTSLGDVLYPSVTARNALGGIVTTPTLTWQALDTTVARMQPDGGVLAVGAGTTRVIATSGTLADTVVVSVSNLPAMIDIAVDADTIGAVGDSVALAVVVRNARGDALANTSVSWTVEDPVVARVGATGVVTARATGTTWVRASGGTAADSARITVTNEPASITIMLLGGASPPALDTMTAAGQSLAYAATVRNAIGAAIPDATLTWRSSNPAVLQVSPSGTATSVGYGTADVIAASGAVEDSVRIAVVDPRRLYVDNAAVTSAQFGTAARPYASIQAAVNAAGVDDTVIVRRGNGYSESVVLGRRLTLLGDSSAFVAGGRDPLLLPRVAHDLDAAGISATTPGATYTIRYLAVQHSVDGEAIAIRDADNVLIEAVHVNPAASFRTGRGILIENAAGTVVVARSGVDSVYGFGVRIRDARDARVDGVTVRGVAARTGHSGAGIEIAGGTAVVTGVAVRRTAGPQVLFNGTTGGSLLASTLVGEQQLARLDAVRGATTVRGNTFDTRAQAGEPAPDRGGGAPDPSALQVRVSAGVLVEGNTFIGSGGQVSLMDGVRLDDVRVGATGAPYGALLTANRFGGGRTAVVAARATFTVSASRVDSAATAVLLTAADTVTLVRDTIATSRVAAVQSGSAGAAIAMTESVVSGPQRAIVVTDAARVTLRQNTITGATGGGIPQPSLGAVDLSATAADVVQNSITGVRAWSAVVLRAGVSRMDSNLVARNLVGVRLGSASSPSLIDNAIFDNDTLPAGSRRVARGLVNEGTARTIGANWWGAPEGPRTQDPLTATSRGDSVVGAGSVGVQAQVIPLLQGAGAPGALRKIVGDTALALIAVAVPMTGRVVDVQGRPLAGASVTFRVPRANGNFIGGVRTGNDNVVTVVSDVHGFATAQYVAEFPGTATITASTGSSSITFTATTP